MIEKSLSFFTILVLLLGIYSLVEVYRIRDRINKRLKVKKNETDVGALTCVRGKYNVGIKICVCEHNKHLPILKTKNNGS